MMQGWFVFGAVWGAALYLALGIGLARVVVGERGRRAHRQPLDPFQTVARGVAVLAWPLAVALLLAYLVLWCLAKLADG